MKGYGRLVAGAAIAGFLALAALVAAPAISDRTPFFTKGEPREALVVQTIVRGEGLVLPRRNGDELPSKPPLFHWMAALSCLARGATSESAIRLPGLVLALTAAAATAMAAWTWWGPATAVVVVVVLGTSFQWLASSVSARVDVVLAALITMALLLFEHAVATGRRVPAIVFALLTAATLTKGPIGLVLPCTVALVTLAVRGELRFVGWREVRLLALAAGAALVWYAAALASGGSAFFAKQILKENFYRVIDPDSVEAGHVAPFWYYVPLLAAGMAPWTLFAPGLVAFALLPVRGSDTQALPEGPPADDGSSQAPPPVSAASAGPSPALVAARARIVFCVVWGAVTFVLFSAAGSKRAVYLLPAYPAYAMLVGTSWSRIVRAGAGGVARALLVTGAAAIAALLVTIALLLVVAAAGVPAAAWLRHFVSNADVGNVVPMLEAIHDNRALVLACAAAILAAAWATITFARAGRWARVVAATVVAVLALAATVSTTLLPAVASKRSARDFVSRVQGLVPLESPLFFYRAFDYGAVFYRGAPIPVRESLADVPGIDGAWLLTWPAYLPDLNGEARKLATGDEAAGAYEVEEAIAPEDHDPSDRTSLVLVRIKRRIGDERSDGNRDR